MSELTFSEFIRRYNSLYKANNEIYHRLARHFGLSDTAFWILYTLREQGGFLQLENVPNNRKNKLVRVTSQGEQLLCQVTDPVFAMEERAFLRLSPHQRQALLDLDEALLDALRQESALILDPPKTP